MYRLSVKHYKIAHINHFEEDDPGNFLFEEAPMTINYMTDAGLSEASQSCMINDRAPE